MSDYRGKYKTDEKHVVTVQSEIISASWKAPKAYAGQEAEFIVVTSLVGEGAEITCEGTSANGVSLEKIEDVIRHNKYVGRFPLPADMEHGDSISFVVKLPGNGLESQSEKIPVLPVIGAHSLQWSKEEANNGDILELSAKVTGLKEADKAEITIYKFDPDGAHRPLARIPTKIVDQKEIKLLWECDYKEDVKEIPSREEMAQYGNEYAYPKYFFTVGIGAEEYGKKKQDSGFLTRPLTAAKILEVENSLFLHGSAVMLPDRAFVQEKGTTAQEKVTGISVLKAVLVYAAQHAERKLLVAGHTDTTGSDAVNFEISLERANGVVALLENQKDDWVGIADKRHTNFDIQYILEWAGCSPGSIDGVLGKNSKKAIRAFQESCGISVDGDWGKQTWGAAFERYQKRLDELLAKSPHGESARKNRKSLNWAYSQNKGVGCGELFPIEFSKIDGRKSQTNRRVEILFMHPEDVPAESCKKGCKKEDCPIYFPPDNFDGGVVTPGKEKPFKAKFWLHDRSRKKMPVGTPYVVAHPEGATPKKATTKEGEAEEVFSYTFEKASVYWGNPDLLAPGELPFKFQEEEFAYMQESDLTLLPSQTDTSSDRENKARAALSNMNYPEEWEERDRVLQFQNDYCYMLGDWSNPICIEPTGELDEKTVDAILEVNARGREGVMGYLDDDFDEYEDEDDGEDAAAGSTDETEDIAAILVVVVLDKKDNSPLANLSVETDNPADKKDTTDLEGRASISCHKSGQLFITIRDENGDEISDQDLAAVDVEPYKTQEVVITVVNDGCICPTPSKNYPYRESTFEMVEKIAPIVKKYAQKYNVPPVAIAGSIADEYNTRTAGKGAIDWFQDEVLLNWMPNFAIEFDVYMNFDTKLLNATKHDIGIGNIKLETAKKIYDQYPDTFEKRDMDYSHLVDYIRTDDGTVHIAALVIKRGQSFLNKYMNNYYDYKQEAVLVTYYKQGKKQYVDRYEESIKSDPHPLQPGEGCRVCLQRDRFLNILK